jgi:glutamate-1-semialdehyde 2,1-aminomutase
MSSVDPSALDRLITAQEEVFVARTTASKKTRDDARDVLAGGVVSSWQDAHPGAVWLSHGKGSHVFDLDGKDYVDLHSGFGAMIVGHGHPAVVKAVQERVELGTHFAQPTPDVVPVARELSRRFKQPLWRFNNSGTEATMDSVHLMRAVTGRQLILKVEGAYHGHHDSVMVSLYPEPDQVGSYDHPTSVPAGTGLLDGAMSSAVVVPFGDLDAVKTALQEHKGQIAGMIIEPIMMNIGMIPPPDGYLQGLADLLHGEGAYLAFDEVKTGFTIAAGGATEWSGVTPDIVALAKSMGGGLPCGAIGGSHEIMDKITDRTYEQVGTFNGNPLTIAAVKATITEVLTADAYEHFTKLRDYMANGAEAILAEYGLPGYVSAYGAKGAVIFNDRITNYRDFLEYDDRWGNAHWLYQHNGGVFLPPWGKCEQWTISVQHTEEDADRFLANLATFAKDAAASA